MKIYPPKKIKVVRIKGKGLGVVATEKIKKGELIEICPVVYLSRKDEVFIEQKSEIFRYYYLRDKKADKICVMFGYGSLYNHDLDANADFKSIGDPGSRKLGIQATKDIKNNEEIVIDYEFKDNRVDFLDLD